MICRTKEDKSINFPVFKLSKKSLTVCAKVIYLGHIITERMTDDEDIERQRRMMYMQANILLRKFSFCSDEVKVSLFKAYCTTLYTAHLWCNYRASSLQKLQVAYNDAMTILLRRPRWHSASEMFVSVRVITFKALLRNLMHRFICRLNASKNEMIVGLSDIRVSTTRYQSKLWTHWYCCIL